MKNWIETNFESILVSFESGKRPKGGVKNFRKGIPSLGAEHLNSKGSFNFDKIKFVPDNFAKDMSKGHIKNKDLLIVKDGATTGKVVFVSESFPYKIAVINEHLFRCHVFEKINSKYIFYFLFSSTGQNRILRNFKGTAQGGINTTFAPNTLIPIAPLNEQNRIVEKIEELFSGLDKAKEELEKVQEQLKVYRQSVLKAAFEGKYVKNFVYKEVPLSEFERKGGGTPSTKKREYWNGDINWITSANIDSQNNIHFDKKITHLGVVNSSTNVIPENSVIVVTRVSLGKVAVNDLDTAINQDCQGIICSNINPYYLMWYLKNIAKEFIFKGQGTTINGITISKLNEIIIKVPGITIQEQIVQEIESRLSVCDKIELTVESGLKQIEHLRQSILKKAFEGKLVPQDPEDPPARELIEQIKIEKEKAKNNSKKKVKA